jgi:hypothetical protein
VGTLVTDAEANLSSPIAPTLFEDRNGTADSIPAIKAGWLCPGSHAGNPDRIEQIEHLVKSGQVEERLSWKERCSEIHAR